MTTTHNPAAMLSTTREPSALAPLDYLPRIDYATGIVLAGALVIGAVLAARRMTRGILTIDQPTKPQPLPVNNALKDAMAAALTDMAVARVQKLQAAQAAAAVIAKAKAIDGMEVHYVESPAGWAPTMPASFDAKRGAL